MCGTGGSNEVLIHFYLYMPTAAPDSVIKHEVVHQIFIMWAFQKVFKGP